MNKNFWKMHIRSKWWRDENTLIGYNKIIGLDLPFCNYGQQKFSSSFICKHLLKRSMEKWNITMMLFLRYGSQIQITLPSLSNMDLNYCNIKSINSVPRRYERINVVNMESESFASNLQKLNQVTSQLHIVTDHWTDTLMKHPKLRLINNVIEFFREEILVIEWY